MASLDNNTSKRFRVRGHDSEGWQIVDVSGGESVSLLDLFDDVKIPVSLPIRFASRRHAECFAAALDLGWAQAEKSGGE